MTMATREIVEIIRNPASVDESLRRRLVEALLTPSQPHKITYEEFLAWADEDTYAEWVNGEVIMTSPASKRHQEICLFLGQIVGIYVKEKGLGETFIPPFQMRLEHSGREPDLLFVASDHLQRLKANYLDGPADLVVEIISPESDARDRGEKFTEYEQAGIPEFWLVDPEREQAEFYQSNERGRYSPTPLDGGVYRSKAIPGLWLRPGWFWQIPPVIQTLQELGVV